MKSKLGMLSRKGIIGFCAGIFSIATIFLLFMGSFYWEGGNTFYDESTLWLRGLEMLAAAGALLLLFMLLALKINRMEQKKAAMLTAACAGGMLLLQIAFVAAARAGIRYDALKVFDEALALFSQKKIAATDLEGYFARYSNNYAMTIMTHWLIKVFRMLGIIHTDFSNAVLVLQIVNIVFTDVAFAGAWALMKKYAGIHAGAVFVCYMLLNPLSYVWLPFYYTNTCSMAFAVWGAYLLLSAFDTSPKSVPKCVGAGILFLIGYKIRATVGIALIAALLTLFCFSPSFREKNKKKILLCLLALVLSMAVTGGIYSRVERHYLAFDETDTEFPVFHWVAMGLSDTGTYSPVDEAYTMGFATAEEKKAADVTLIKERACTLGATGVLRLYFKKLALTFGDGAGGYHSELNLSQNYGVLWQVVYGVYRDPLLAVTQIFYLSSLAAGLGMLILLWKRKLPGQLFFLPLLLLGSYLFQMIWEAGTIYSIGTMYINGCMMALFLTGISPLLQTGAFRKKYWFWGMGIGIVGICLMVRSFLNTDYVDVTMSVDQFLFQANEYPALTDGMEIRQTFVTDKVFSKIALEVDNPEGEYNDSVYLVGLYDEQGNLLKEQLLQGSQIRSYTFYPLAFENREGVSSYEIRISKQSGKHDLIFLYYDTGHYDVYPEGRLTGLTQGNTADLAFEVYWREEED